MDLELLQTFIRITHISPQQCVAHIGHPEKNSTLLVGSYVDVKYDGNFDIKFNPEKEMLLVAYREEVNDFVVAILRREK